MVRFESRTSGEDAVEDEKREDDPGDEDEREEEEDVVDSCVNDRTVLDVVNCKEKIIKK